MSNAWLMLALICVAAWNATQAATGGNTRWSVAGYWMLVGLYWMMRAAEAGS